jgi:hypothetical protein
MRDNTTTSTSPTTSNVIQKKKKHMIQLATRFCYRSFNFDLDALRSTAYSSWERLRASLREYVARAIRIRRDSGMPLGYASAAH